MNESAIILLTDKVRVNTDEEIVVPGKGIYIPEKEKLNGRKKIVLPDEFTREERKLVSSLF